MPGIRRLACIAAELQRGEMAFAMDLFCVKIEIPAPLSTPQAEQHFESAIYLYSHCILVRRTESTLPPKFKMLQSHTTAFIIIFINDENEAFLSVEKSLKKY